MGDGGRRWQPVVGFSWFSGQEMSMRHHTNKRWTQPLEVVLSGGRMAVASMVGCCGGPLCFSANKHTHTHTHQHILKHVHTCENTHHVALSSLLEEDDCRNDDERAVARNGGSDDASSDDITHR